MPLACANKTFLPYSVCSLVATYTNSNAFLRFGRQHVCQPKHIHTRTHRGEMSRLPICKASPSVLLYKTWPTRREHVSYRRCYFKGNPFVNRTELNIKLMHISVEFSYIGIHHDCLRVRFCVVCRPCNNISSTYNVKSNRPPLFSPSI